jgi:hypothetical protein
LPEYVLCAKTFNANFAVANIFQFLRQVFNQLRATKPDLSVPDNSAFSVNTDATEGHRNFPLVVFSFNLLFEASEMLSDPRKAGKLTKQEM